MQYHVHLEKHAKKQLDKIPVIYRAKFEKVIDSLVQDPFSGKKLEGKLKGQYSVRVWPYRIIYRIYKKKLIVLIIDIGHRQGVY